MLTRAESHHPGIDFRHDAERLGRVKVARVVVPEGPTPPGGWPVCYLLHSFGGNRLSWLEAIDLESFAACLFVLPESGRRWFINDARGRRYEDYLLEDLIPAVDRAWPTRGASRRVIGGFSMGGAAAVYAALRHPRCFSAAFSYAGAFYASRRQGDPYAKKRSQGCMMPTEQEHDRVWGAPGSPVRRLYDPQTILGQPNTPGTWPRLVLAVGVDDFPRVVEMNRKMHGALEDHGIPHDYLERPGDHSWQSAGPAAEWALQRLEISTVTPRDHQVPQSVH